MATPQPTEDVAVSSEAPQSDSKAEGKADQKTGGKVQAQAQAQAQKSTAAQPAGDAPKKLSGAELKAQKQAEKAKRRAAVVAAKEAAGGVGQPKPGQGPGAGGGGGGGGGGKAKGKTGADAANSAAAGGGGSSGPGAGAGPGQISGSLARRPSVAAAAAAAAAATATAEREREREKDARSGIPECFSHLSMAKRISVSQAHKDVHPAVLAVGQQMATFTLRDSIARLEATLVAFKRVIQSYRTPPGNAFSRHFVSHVLNPQIEYLTECRPMCFAMGNGIRLLKARVSQLDLDLDDKDAIEDLCDSVDAFIQERIHVAAVVITREAAEMIHNGDTVLTYGGPRLVRAALEAAWANGIQFDLTVVDDPADPAAGQALAKHFRSRRRRRADGVTAADGGSDDSDGPDVRVTYSPSLDGLDSHVARASKVFVGVESVFANGALLAPVGTCDVAQSASALGCPVIALSETVNFDRDRVATDALAHNEIDPDHCDSDSFRLLFDTTQSSLVSMLITEYEEASGMVPAQAIYSVLRSKEDLN